MARKPVPVPSFLDQAEFFGIRGGEKVWRSTDHKRYYTWDSLHGEIEVYTRNGYHLGSLAPISGALIKPAVKGRKIEP